MNMMFRIMAVSVLACVATTVGCKKVEVTVWNHSDNALDVRVTVPDGTMSLGTVGANGARLSYTIKIDNEDLPAHCSMSAGVGNTQSFTVTEDTKDKLWFHIAGNGRLAGPYPEDSEHVESETTTDIESTVRQETIITE